MIVSMIENKFCQNEFLENRAQTRGLVNSTLLGLRPFVWSTTSLIDIFQRIYFDIFAIHNIKLYILCKSIVENFLFSILFQ